MRRIFAIAAVALASLPGEALSAVPAGFEDALVAAIAFPTALAFTPDGRLLVTTQPGQLRVVENGALLAAPALDLAPVICSNSERGLLGVAVDPEFATNRFIYLFYTFKKFASCPVNTSAAPVNRVSRFMLADDNTVSLASELILIDNIPSPGGNHNAGDVHVGPDGLLYISVGDGGCDYRGDSGCAALNDAARDLHVLVGKILRVTRTGAIPADNPFRAADSVRCNATGRASPGQKCQEIFASGLRNPFRIAFDPNAAGTRFFINDVGQNTWEEIDEGLAGADYGWNVREGNCATGSATDCGPPPPGMTNPIHAYQHRGTCEAITGGAFVPDGVWPPEFTGTYLFGDYTCGTIFRLARGTDGLYQRTAFVTGLGESSAVAMIFGPHNGTQALYYTTYTDGGQVRRIATSGNRAPTASATASPRSGPVPLTVHFDASGSSDPDGDALTFAWAFNDGSPDATGPAVTHTYSVGGRFTAVVTVRDSRGATDIESIVIDAGNTPPSASISSPSATARFAVGQTITLRGAASDAQDGALPDANLSWRVILHHGTHTHPFLGPVSGNGITFRAPAPEDLEATTNSHLEILLTATDSHGASATVQRTFQPRLVSLTFESVPTGLTVVVNGTSMATPRTVTSWEGYRLAVTAPTQKDAAGQAWLFSSWSDGSPASRSIITPAAAATYTARFAAAAVVAPTADAYVRNGVYAAQNFGTAALLNVKHSSTLDNQRQAFVRFTIGDRTIGRAVLRLHGGLSSAGEVRVAVHSVADTTWAETALTWNTRPPRGTTALATRTIKGTAKNWYEWDVTSYLRAERAAGRTAAGFVLLGTVGTSPYASFSSRNASSNRPELIVSDATALRAPGEIVLYAADASAIAGAWRLVADSTAAAGLRMSQPDAGAAKLVTPLAAPANYFELSFHAEAGRAYRLWIRGKAANNSYANDSAHVQFSGSVTSTGAATWRIGTTSSTVYVLEDCAGCGVSGWGWSDNGYGGAGPLVYFAVTGPQTLRVQTREDGLSIDQIVLSPGTYLNTAPGATKNDSTILER
jgi:glucose/arabinose dehydrogenase/PKD repeat protein